MNNIKITDVRVQPGDSSFLIDDGKTAILYDSGFAFTGFAVADNIKKELGERELDYIFLTHSHYDHALGSVYALQYWPNAKVVAGEYAAKIFSKPTAKALMRDLDKKFAEKCGVTEYEDLIDNLKVDIPAKDGDIIKAGDMTFTVINLPGHTKCSVGYYLQEEKLLLSVESIGVYDGESTVFPSYLVGYQMALDSIQRVIELDIENILLPHFGLLNREQTQFYLKSAKKSSIDVAEDFIQMAKGGKSNEEIADYFKHRFYNDKVKTFYPEDAFMLNTRIMVDLIKRECL